MFFIDFENMRHFTTLANFFERLVTLPASMSSRLKATFLTILSENSAFDTPEGAHTLCLTLRYNLPSIEASLQQQHMHIISFDKFWFNTIYCCISVSSQCKD